MVKLSKSKRDFYETGDVGRLQPQNILFVIGQFLDFLCVWKKEQVREGCGLFTLAERASTMCKDSARAWCDLRSPSDRVLSCTPADSKPSDAGGIWGQELKSLRAALPHPAFPKCSWHNYVIGLEWFYIVSINSWIKFMAMFNFPFSLFHNVIDITDYKWYIQ